MGHGAAQAAYLDWKVSLLGNVPHSTTSNAKGAVFADFTPLAELGELHDAVYFGDGRKHLSWDYLKSLTPLALAVWYMDDGCFTVRSKGVQERTRGGTGRIEICVEAMSAGSRERLASYLRDTHGLDVKVVARGARKMNVLQFTTAASEKFQRIIAPYIHPSMDGKLLPRFRGTFAVQPEFVPPKLRPVPARVLDIHVKPPTRSMNRFDIEVEGSHNYFVDGVMVHNSPETTSGGKALKFYASVRLDVRRIETLKDGTDAVGNRTRVKVVKNKMSPPFKVAEFDILYGVGISREGSLIDLGVEQGIVRKAGAWYTYEGDQLGQGKENARTFLKENPDTANEIEKKIKEKLGVGPRLDADPNAYAAANGVPAAGAANGRPAGGPAGVTAGAAGKAPAGAGRAPRPPARAGHRARPARAGRRVLSAWAGSRAPAEARAVPSRQQSVPRSPAGPREAQGTQGTQGPPGRPGPPETEPAGTPAWREPSGRRGPKRPLRLGPPGPRPGRKPVAPEPDEPDDGLSRPPRHVPGDPGPTAGTPDDPDTPVPGAPRPRRPGGRRPADLPAPAHDRAEDPVSARGDCSGGTSRARPPRPSWTGSPRRA